MFTPIDVKTWPRAQMFYYFSQMAPTGFSITAKVDVTTLKRTLKTNNLKFFPAYIWLTTKNLNKQIEFKVSVQNDVLGYFDTLTPLYPSFHDDDKTVSLMWNEYKTDFMSFYSLYLENQKKYGDTHGVLCQSGTTPPPNTYTVSCIPWISFEHFSVHSYENKPYYFPSVEAGKYCEDNGKLMMPISLTCHHATTDGYHVNCFFEDLQRDMNNFEMFLK